ncbi:unnamed protein product [Arabidopsis halleri]
MVYRFCILDFTIHSYLNVSLFIYFHSLSAFFLVTNFVCTCFLSSLLSYLPTYFFSHGLVASFLTFFLFFFFFFLSSFVTCVYLLPSFPFLGCLLYFLP